MCADDFVTIDPLTWRYKCAMRECDSCPEFETVLGAAILTGGCTPKRAIKYSMLSFD
jgi:hypothetical protein